MLCSTPQVGLSYSCPTSRVTILPGKPGKVIVEFQSGQGKVRANEKSQGILEKRIKVTINIRHIRQSLSHDSLSDES